jgi:hypothetical protein
MQTDQDASAKERDDIGVFTSITNGMREIVESLMTRDWAEGAGSLAIGAAVAAVVGKAISGAAKGFLTGGPSRAILGALGGIASGIYSSPVGEYIGGWLYDQATKNRVPPDPNSVYTPMGDYTGFIDDSSGQGNLDQLRKQPVAPPPQLSFGPNRTDRDKTPPTVGAPSGTPLSFGPPPPSGGKTPPPAWTQPNLPLSMGSPVSERDRPPVGPTWPVGQPVPGMGPAAAPKGNLQPRGGSDRDRQSDPRPVGGGTGSGSSGGGGSGGGAGGSGSGSASNPNKGPSFECSGRSGSGGKSSSNSSSAGGWA